MHEASLPQWERHLIEEAITQAEARVEAAAAANAERRALQLAREQAYHRLAAAIDRPARAQDNPAQLRLWAPEPTLFDEAG